MANRTIAEGLLRDSKLIKYVLMRARVDGRPLQELFVNEQWVGKVCGQFAAEYVRGYL